MAESSAAWCVVVWCCSKETRNKKEISYEAEGVQTHMLNGYISNLVGFEYDM